MRDVPLTVADPISGLQRLTMAQLPTPMDEAPRLAAELGLARFLVKREDQSGYALGGNKLRQLDFILAEALASGADTIVSTAGAQSNFCRALAGACARLGLACRLHLRGAPSARQGNLLLDHLFDATISFTRLSDPWSPGIRAELDAIVAELVSAGRHPHLVQLTGPTATTGVAAWAAAAPELLADFDRCATAPQAIVVAAGSGLTAAGIALGLTRLGRRIPVLAMSVQQPASRLTGWLQDCLSMTARRLSWPIEPAQCSIEVIDAHLGPDYGMPSEESLAAVRLAGRTEALVLDPVYTGKAMAGLMAVARSGRFGPRDSIAFLHSGGAPGLFAHAPAFD
jgi:1-aminocyclopropane-1-carboxylate deaminase/D-cysteine desulfhydrase-like pyridoxal-dependent ACC family enzyme